MEYIFTLKYELADKGCDPCRLVEQLGEAGCRDVLVGTGRQGHLALECVRDAESADAAVHSAVADIQRALPLAKLLEVVPNPAPARA